jgi:excisionase family DNA binding protein
MQPNPQIHTRITRRLFTTEEAAEYTGRGKNTFEQERLKGGGVPFVRLGRSVRYDVADLDAWIDSHKHRSTSEYMRG